MKKSLSFVPLFCLSLVYCVASYANATDDGFTQQEVIEDFATLYQSLIDTHYNVYAYISQQEFDDKYHAIRDSLTESSYSLLATITVYQQLVSAINNGHTEIDFPVKPYLEFAERGGTLFPLDLAFENGQALVRANYSGNHTIPKGSEVVAINGMSIADIVSKISPQISAEREYFKLAKLEVLSFPRYFWYVFGEQKSFTVSLRNEGKVDSVKVDAVPVFSGFEEVKDEILNAQKVLRFYGHTAYLNPGHFSGDEQEYRAFIDDAFSQILSREASNLIIDLRNNSGGNDSFSDYLVAYLATEPFKWTARFSLRTSRLLQDNTREHRDLQNPYWKTIMENPVGTRYEYDFGYKQPVSPKRRFTGKVYTLINRHSHSQASVTAAQIQDYKLATMVGEETGDYPSLYASQFQYVLPKTGITVKISKGHIVRVNGSQAEQGVVPDISIVDHLLDEQDEILDGLLQYISE